jgi:pyruvate/2-oxoglutarate/acetoin dehydrogenase E1 component/TPP-dependent pyruvate/acetoin dehydrogenase alpha subunit
MKTMTNQMNSHKLSFETFKAEVLQDYRTAVLSRECSLMGRREVLTGKAKFGIFGDGKELPQLAMAKAFQKGDWRSGYYRDQTFMMSLDLLNANEFFAGLYAHVDIEADPMSAGRQMGGHFMTHSLDENGEWKNLSNQYNSSSDISPTAGQMPRLLGLAQASKVFKELSIPNSEKFSKEGSEVAWGTIGNASTSEGLFFETFNAAGVLQVPMVISVWDDDYGISVHARHQTTKENISEILKGFQRDNDNDGYEILRVNGWDYVALVETYERASKIAREQHVPVLVHVQQLTQPQGHSTSGSHERYKSKDRLAWEVEYDCNAKMREWILDFELETEEGVLRFVEDEQTLIDMEKSLKKEVAQAKRNSWNAFLAPIISEREELIQIFDSLSTESSNKSFIQKAKNDLLEIKDISRRDILDSARSILHLLRTENPSSKSVLSKWIQSTTKNTQIKYSSLLYNESESAAIHVEKIEPKYSDEDNLVDARVILRDNFDSLFDKKPEVLIFGEDAGFIGDVNQGLEGMQEKFGETRVADTGIREASIIGQGIGMAMRGLRPIAEIQYLDYLLYALQILSDDLATLRYRTFGKQKAPLIVRTRGHRLEGIWHSGSPMGTVVNALRGMYILVPRNMTKAAGFYNTLLQSDEPALVIENLNGYRLKEKMPLNLGEFTTKIGEVECVRTGKDISVLSYGSTLRIVEEAAVSLMQVGIDIEIIDAQSLVPFDLNKDTVKSIAKTNRFMVIDEDVPGGGAAYLMQKVLEDQDAYHHLDSAPKTLTAKAHRPAYGSDGDYFSKPSKNDIFEAIYKVMNEADPESYPELY